jgi:molybdopterin converting factor small subunit
VNDTKAAWDQVGERFSELGQRLKQQYDARAAFTPEESQQVDDALHKLTDALDSAFTALGDTLRDQDVREQLKGTATSLASAVTTTFNELTEDIKSRFGRSS